MPCVDKPGGQELLLFNQSHNKRYMFYEEPLNIVGMEVPKYTVRLGRFHIQSLGTSIGLRLDS